MMGSTAIQKTEVEAMSGFEMIRSPMTSSVRVWSEYPLASFPATAGLSLAIEAKAERAAS